MTKEINIIKRSKGQPRKYTPDALLKAWDDYYYAQIEAGQLPTQIGFIVALNINQDTFYNYMTMGDYSECKKRIDAMLEAATIKLGMEARNPAFIIFYLKNKFGWSDKNDDQPQANVNILNLSNLSLAELQKLAAGEAIED